jgi:hypothetical protein
MNLKEVRFNDTTTLYFDASSDNLVARRIGDRSEWGTFVQGGDGTFYLLRGLITVDLEFARAQLWVENGNAVGGTIDWLVDSGQMRSLVISPTAGATSVQFNLDGTIEEGMIRNSFTGVEVVINDGTIHRLSVPNPDTLIPEDILSRIDVSNLSPKTLFELIKVGVGNGVANEEQEGVLPENMQKFLDDVANEIDPRFALPLPGYETGNVVKDVLSWVLDGLGTDIITNEVRAKLNTELTARGSLPPTMVSYSGNFNPLLRAIEREGYGINTILAVGAPTVMDNAIPDQVKQIVYVVGEDDIVPLVNREPTFRHKDGTAVETIIVRVKNSAGSVTHTDYFQLPNDTNPYHTLSHNFLLELTKSLSLNSDPKDLLNILGTPSADSNYLIDLADPEFQARLNEIRTP